MEIARRRGATAKQAAKGVSTLAFTIGGVIVLAIGVPLAWVWAASMLAGDDRQLTTPLALFTGTGILVTYWVLLLVGGFLRERLMGEEETAAKVRRASWNRSFRDEPLEYGKTKMDPIERVFILTAILGILLFEVWFFFFAGSPLGGVPQTV